MSHDYSNSQAEYAGLLTGAQIEWSPLAAISGSILVLGQMLLALSFSSYAIRNIDEARLLPIGRLDAESIQLRRANEVVEQCKPPTEQLQPAF
jgi:hypothetical protein